uniref:Putative Fe-S oxidoreductase n=1 Tax=uncultured bacterium 1114 TaxID=548901 RepID=B8R954_9BACT|nr:putative Fe-S oxidoreductase [uncultured bacterium 1114]
MSQVIYSPLKPFRYPERLRAIGAGEVPAPVHVRIKPTNVCNHSCWFCAYRSDAVSLGNGMNERDRISREKMIEIVADLAAMGVEAVTFSGGGEPLIYPHLVEVIDRLAAGGIRIGALTNGSMLKGKVADAFARHGTWLRVSIDGWDGASYARSRSVDEHEFDKVIANLTAFAARGSDCALGASVIVGKANAKHLLDLCGQLKRAGVGHVKIAPCIVRDSAVENDAYHREIEAVVRSEIGLIRGLEDERFRVNDHYHALGERFDRSEHRCPMAYLLTIIGADQVVYSCQDKAYTDGGALGSIRDRSFRAFWQSGEARSALAAINPSRDCRHHCVASVKNERILDYLSLDPEHSRFV